MKLQYDIHRRIHVFVILMDCCQYFTIAGNLLLISVTRFSFLFYKFLKALISREDSFYPV